jgi:hypothetical protein
LTFDCLNVRSWFIFENSEGCTHNSVIIKKRIYFRLMVPMDVGQRSVKRQDVALTPFLFDKRFTPERTLGRRYLGNKT